MNNSKIFWPVAVLTFLISLFGLSLLALGADYLHPRLGCQSVETSYWSHRTGVLTFERVSSYFWSSLCASEVPPLVISASEGTGAPTFPDLLAARGIQADQFMGAYRGLKTFGYMVSEPIHPERLKNLRALVFINPVYYSFAAHTDASTIRVNALSNLSYILRVHSFVQKWDEFLFESFYVTLKDYLEELGKFQGPPVFPKAELKDTFAPVPDDEFIAERNMLKERAPHFTSFRGRFSSHEQPTRLLFQTSVRFITEHPDLPVCLVLLPTNTRNLKYFDRDAEAIASDMSDSFKIAPQGHGVDLQFLNNRDKIFRDPMHLTPYGKSVVLDEVLKTDCGHRVFDHKGIAP